MKRAVSLRGAVAVVTGAASGIGRALAEELAREGANLAISDVNTEGLAETRARVAGRGVEVHETRLDVADREAVHRYAQDVVDGFGAVNVVINNAGVALSAPVSEMSYDDLEWLMAINFWGVVHGTKAFLPILQRADWGQIVNLSSVFGFVGIPTQAAYNASKFAVRGFTEALIQDLRLAGGNVAATVVHPGGVRTNIARAARYGGVDQNESEQLVSAFDRLAITTPEAAARRIVAGIRRRERRVLVGPDAFVFESVSRLAPVSYQHVITELVRRRNF